MISLKDRIAQAIEAGHSQSAMMEATGVSSGGVSHWASGRTLTLKAEPAAALAKLTGWRFEWWVSGTGPREESGAAQRAQESANRALTRDELASIYDTLGVPERRKLTGLLVAGGYVPGLTTRIEGWHKLPTQKSYGRRLGDAPAPTGELTLLPPPGAPKLKSK